MYVRRDRKNIFLDVCVKGYKSQYLGKEEKKKKEGGTGRFIYCDLPPESFMDE